LRPVHRISAKDFYAEQQDFAPSQVLETFENILNFGRWLTSRKLLKMLLNGSFKRHFKRRWYLLIHDAGYA
jgi:hypothetical protein